MILSKKTFRFSRLDTVDDPDEFSYSKAYDINYTNYIYVACWSNNSNESIPQWKIYGNNQKGVRIALDHDMFLITYTEIEKVKLCHYCWMTIILLTRNIWLHFLMFMSIRNMSFLRL